jgi:hypothetical protein
MSILSGMTCSRPDAKRHATFVALYAPHALTRCGVVRIKIPIEKIMRRGLERVAARDGALGGEIIYALSLAKPIVQFA